MFRQLKARHKAVRLEPAEPPAATYKQSTRLNEKKASTRRS